MDPYFVSMEFIFMATDGNVSLGGGRSQNSQLFSYSVQDTIDIQP